MAVSFAFLKRSFMRRCSLLLKVSPHFSVYCVYGFHFFFTRRFLNSCTIRFRVASIIHVRMVCMVWCCAFFQARHRHSFRCFVFPVSYKLNGTTIRIDSFVTVLNNFLSETQYHCEHAVSLAKIIVATSFRITNRTVFLTKIYHFRGWSVVHMHLLIFSWLLFLTGSVCFSVFSCLFFFFGCYFIFFGQLLSNCDIFCLPRSFRKCFDLKLIFTRIHYSTLEITMTEV